MLKFFELEARFPRDGGELPPAAVAYVAELGRGRPQEFDSYDWSGRTIKYHRAQIREALGFREVTRADEQRLTDWLAVEVCPDVLSEERQRNALLARCRSERLEPPGQPERILGTARRAADERFCHETIDGSRATQSSGWRRSSPPSRPMTLRRKRAKQHVASGHPVGPPPGCDSLTARRR